jgi:hypothetical protein
MTTKLPLLTNLSGTVAAGEFIEPRGILTTVHHEGQPGVFVKVQLGEGGLIIRHRQAAVGIPLAELLALAAQLTPEVLGLARLRNPR